MLGSAPESRWRIPSILLLFTLFFYWQILFTNRAMFPWDAVDFFYPNLAFVHEELRHFRLPLWNPYSMSGFPTIGDPEAQIFYPPNWMMLLLHPFSPLPYKFVEVVEVMHFLLAGLFMYWLAKDFTKDTLSALLGGVLFMSSGAMVAHTEHVATIEAMAWYPLVFLLARRGLLERKFMWTILAGLFMGLENLTGHWQHAVYLGLLLFLYFSYEACAGPLRRRLWPHWIIHLSAIGAIGAGLALIQIIPAAQLSPLSIRTYLTYWDVTAGNEPRFLWTLFLPNFLGGLRGVPYVKGVEPSFNYVFLTVPGCLLALVGLVETARRRNFFWFGLILLSAELSFGRLGILGMLVYRTPLLNLFRQMPVFFDLGNLGLCLMAAFGTKALLDADSRDFYRRWLPVTLVVLLLVAAGLGLINQFPGKIHGWYHMLVVLALFSILVAAWMRGWIRPQIAAAAALVLMSFDLCFYSMNQKFNRARDNPRINVAYDYAAQRKESLEFLRADRGGDFRVAGFDGDPWGSNGGNVWRLPSIFGWNPLMLRSYQEYIRQFIHSSAYAQPYGGPDHRMNSPLMDLLGVKYLVAIDPVEREQRLAESTKYEKVFAEPNWRTIYRSKDYLARSWFYPHAYVLPDRESVLALMNSRWFKARRTLLYAAQDLPAGPPPGIESLTAISVLPDKVSASSTGRAETDPGCAGLRPVYRYWGGKGHWIRFDIGGPAEPGRYVLLAEYASAASAAPVLVAELYQDGRRQSSDPVVMPRTTDWNCRSMRFAELGKFELTTGAARITLTLIQDPSADLFALRLVRLPSDTAAAEVPETINDSPAKAADFSFRDFNVAADRLAFHADLNQDGFVFLNEIYYPGWEAKVDGRPAEILPADYIFRALAVPAGSHRIEMRFRPRRFWLGASVSFLTLAGLLCYFFLRRRWVAAQSRPSRDPAEIRTWP